MPTFLPPLIILAAAAFAILLVLYRWYDSRVEAPRKLEDELRDGLGTFKADVQVLEPVRKAAAASSFAGDRLIIVEDFGKRPHRPYTMSQLMGMEVVVDDKVVGRITRGGPTKTLDDLAPTVHRVKMRLIIDDPSFPSFELTIWDPHDALTARAEGPMAALKNVRQWFYHVEAVLRRTLPGAAPKPATPPATPVPPPTQAAAAAVAPPAATPAPSPDAPATPKPPAKPEGDVLNAPMIPYI